MAALSSSSRNRGSRCDRGGRVLPASSAQRGRAIADWCRRLARRSSVSLLRSTCRKRKRHGGRKAAMPSMTFTRQSVFLTEPRQPDRDHSRLAAADLLQAALQRRTDLGGIAYIFAIGAAGFGFLGEIDRRIEIAAGVAGLLREGIRIFVGDRQGAGAVAAIDIDHRHERLLVMRRLPERRTRRA